MRGIANRLLAVIDTVISRYKASNAVTLCCVAFGLLLLAGYWLLAPPQSMPIGHAAGLAGIAIFVAGYYFVRSGRIFHALVWRDREAIVVREENVHGLGWRSLSVSSIKGLELQVNEAGRALLIVHLNAGGLLKTPLGECIRRRARSSNGCHK